MYNTHIYNKDTPRYISFIDSIKYNKIFYIAYTITFLVIGIITNDIPRCLFTAAYMPYHAYFAHIIGHDINPFKKLHGIHHTKEINHKWYNELIEFLINLVYIGGGYLIPINIYLDMYDLTLLNSYGILAFTLLYTTHHMINYHYLTIPSHVKHHENDIELGGKVTSSDIKNYGPDTIDVVFGTKNEDEEYEDMKYTAINILIIMIIIVYIYKSDYDLIELLKNKIV